MCLQQNIIMSSLRDKINSKLNINTNAPKPNTQNITNFDQTWLKIKVVGGQSQLYSIKLDCTWVYPNIAQRPPQLNCKWFNKTQNSMAIIEGINGSYYQPSLVDVGSIIHVQCMPELPGAEYDGMPIIKEIGPIKIDNETQQQANDLLQAGKATFSIKLKTVNDQSQYREALLKIQGNIFRVLSKTTQQQQQLISIQINESNPVLKCIRAKARQLQIELSQKTEKGIQKMLVELASNKIRDVLVLLVKLIAVRNGNIEEEKKIQEEKSERGKDTKMTENKQEESKEEQKPKSKEQLKQLVQQEENKIKQNQKELAKSQQKLALMESPRKKQSNQQQYTKESEKQKQASLKDNQSISKNSKNSKNSQKSEEELGQYSQISSSKKDSNSKVNEVKSSEDLTTITSPVKKHGSKIENSTVTPTSHKQNALEVLQITDLKKQLRANEGQILQLKKTISEKNEIIEEKEEEINRMKERQANLSCNYFQLEDQIKKIKDNSQKSSEEVSYYRNENRILKTQNQAIMKKNKALTQQIIELQEKLAPFLHQDEEEEKVETYGEIRQKYQRQIKMREELEAKYQYMKEQAAKMEEKYHEMKQMMDDLEGQKNFYKKKYENVSVQLQSQHSSPTHSPLSYSPIPQSKQMMKMQSIKSRSSIDQSPRQEIQKVQTQDYSKMQRQILDLKKQLKQIIEQNNFLRSINAVGANDKKSSSKQHLKLELTEMKKIVNRLTETVTEKDLALQHMKNVNKEISQKLLSASKKLEEYEKGENEGL